MGDSNLYRTILPAGTVVTATGSQIIGVASDFDPTTLDVVVNISAVSGTLPTLTVSVERDASPARGTFPPTVFAAPTSTAALSTVARTVMSVPAAMDSTGTSPTYARVTWTVGGTNPSFTLGLYAE